MAKKKNVEANVASIDKLNEDLTNVTRKVEENKKTIVWVATGILAVAVLVLAYINFIHIPGEEEANNALGQVDLMQINGANDSTLMVEYQKVADNYGHDAGSLAALKAGKLLYKAGKYDEAINYLKKYDAKEAIVGASSQALIGDCYANLNNLEEAVSYMKRAVKKSNKNELYTPIYLVKLAHLYRAQEKYADEYDAYNEIKTKYPNFGQAYQLDVEKYLERARIQAGK